MDENHIERSFNDSRVVYYESNGWAAGESLKRCGEFLHSYQTNSIANINDAIEVDQVKRIVEKYPGALACDDAPLLTENLMKAIADAYAFARQLISSGGIDPAFQILESQYFNQFWDLLEASNALDAIDEKAFRSFLASHPYLIRPLLHRPKVVKKFGASLASVMTDNSIVSAESIISGLGASNPSSGKIRLPKELSSDDIDGIVRDYLNSESPNLNYVHILANWPNSAKGSYSPSAKNIVLAERKERELADTLFSEESGIKFGVGVTFDGDQLPCLDVTGSIRELVFSYSSKWLFRYHDHATILNNYIFVFQFVNKHGLLCMPANPRLVSTLMKVIGMHAKDEYAVHDHSFFVQSTRCLASTSGYSALLHECGTSIESAIEWFYNSYIEETFGINGFGTALPKEASSFFEKCKSIGPEIERSVKAFTLFVEDGEIDHDLFPHTPFNDFNSVPSLISKKYAFPGKEFDSYAFSLFSDQSLLSSLPNREDDCDCAYDLLLVANLKLDDFYDFQQNELKRLLGLGLIFENQESFLKPTFKATLLKKTWHEGALTPYRLPDDICSEIGYLVKEGALQYSESLFAPQEGDYMNFMFNNRCFSNALALRNKYDHASGAVGDPNNSTYANEYYQLLNLLVCITLKINDELAWKSGEFPALDLIDWPLTGDAWMSL